MAADGVQGGADAQSGRAPEALARAVIRAIEPYAWEESSEALAARYGLAPAQVERFDTNTSPFPPVGLAETLERTLREPYVNEYFDTSYAAVTAGLAGYAGKGAGLDVGARHLIVGAGADEILDLVARTFLNNGDRVVIPVPTYSMYRIGAESMGATVITVPYGPAPGFGLPVDELLQAARGAKLLYVCAPNNPTGTLPAPDDLHALVSRAPCMVVVDEAYYEFCGQTVVGLVEQAPHVIVVRTLSKAFSLAGGRLGYAIAAPRAIDLLNRVRPPNSVSYITALLAEEALRRTGEMRERVRVLLAEKARLEDALRAAGVECLPSRTNFFLTAWPDAASAEAVHEALLAEGLVLRRFAANPRLARYLRITVRAAGQNTRLIAALTALGRRGA
jgi:histidinol-phosphate aminotransferase